MLIRLSKLEVDVATDLGMTVEEYARNKYEIQRMAEEHEKWLQTPAGIEWAAARAGKLEAERKRRREYDRAYRARKKAESVECYARRDATIWTLKNVRKALNMIASGMSRAAVARSFNASGDGLKSALNYSERCVKGRKHREEQKAREQAEKTA